MHTEASFEVRRTLRGAAPSLPYEKIARRILGNEYSLSLVLCGDALARRMYRQYRHEALGTRKHVPASYASNVLSFPYSKTEGEIFLNVRKAAREARTMGISHRARLALLFVHGCFHLKGLDHGATMESEEQRVLREFGLA